DKIVTIKTFRPDKPGNFSGGTVEMWTRRFPESFTLSFSQSASYNSQNTFNSNALTCPGGGLDWLGMDDGSRDVPGILKDPATVIPDIGAAWTDRGKAVELDKITSAFNPVMAPSRGSLPMNHSWSLSMGNKAEFLGRPVGVFGSLSYSRKSSYYNHGEVGRWQLTGDVNEISELNNDYLLNDERGTEEALLGGLMNFSCKLTPDHEIGLNYLFNQSGESEARYLHGPFPRDLTGNAVYETRVMKFTERKLNSMQLRGEHDIQSLFGSHIEWTGSFNTSYQQEPDLRFFTDNYTIRERNGTVDTSYAIRTSIYPQPNRYYRDLNEDNINLNFSLSVPFKQWNKLHSRLKLGWAFNKTDRRFRERRYEFRTDHRNYAYNGDPHAFWQEGNMGLVDTTGRLNRFANYVIDASEKRGNYDGDKKVAAGFAMVELPLTEKLQFIGGLRVESTRMNVTSRDESLGKGRIDENDFLPAANLIFLVSNDMNLRAAYGRTLARPTFREMAPYSSFDFINDLIFTGNENLERTLIHNFDLRWEWFVGNGDILSASLFYKKFDNPIERVIKTINGEVQYQNVDRADVAGIELEARQSLKRIHPWLERFQIGGNLTFVHSNVDIAPEEFSKIRAFDKNASQHRPMQGQSPYVLNADINYTDDYRGTSAALIYGVFGKRLSEVSLGGTPDVYEMPHGMLDFTLKQRIWRDVSLRFTAKNLLNTGMEKVYTFKGRKFTSRKYGLGRMFTLGVSYSMSAE
ncbi:MAG: TonB-dependent receptor, partial [Gemmatimonadota bacterium]|nr:TonB-dependent receptor [Gemmatimonadota bacterium]